MGIMISNHLQHHISQLDMNAVPGYVAKITLWFKGCSLIIYGLYFPPSDTITQGKILKFFRGELSRNKYDKSIFSVILGDFNSIRDQNMDRSSNSRLGRKPSALIRLLEDNLYIDVYRHLHPNRREYTWNNHNESNLIETRIDYIWVSYNWAGDILYSAIEDIKDITSSDHNIVLALTYTGHIIRNNNKSQQKRRAQSRNIYDYQVAKPEHWAKYQEIAEFLFNMDEQLHNLLSLSTLTQQQIDTVWIKVISYIQTAAHRSIPRGDVKYRNRQSLKKAQDFRPKGMLAHLSCLRKLKRQILEDPLQTCTIPEILHWNGIIDECNAEYELNIPLLHADGDTWIKDSTPHIQLLKKCLKIMAIKARDECINKALIARAENTITNQSKMLSSILDKDFRSIRVDRLITVNSIMNRPTLHNTPEDILKIAPTCYKDLLKKRNHQFDSMSED